MDTLCDKVAVITAAASGSGRAIARAGAGPGATAASVQIGNEQAIYVRPKNIGIARFAQHRVTNIAAAAPTFGAVRLGSTSIAGSPASPIDGHPPMAGCH